MGQSLFCLALCLSAAGCGSLGPTPGLSAQARGLSVAFESIDGPPREISQKLVHDLNEEAPAFRIAVVPSGGEASYRARGYLAAHPEGASTSIAWAWDVYDAELQRAFRLSGEERVGAPGRGNNWAAADEALLRRIARAGLEQLAGFATSAPAPIAAPPAPAERSGSAVASDDSAAPDPAAISAPRGRSALAGLTSTAGLANAASGR